jgi:ABC-2 type transport system permease protein
MVRGNDTNWRWRLRTPRCNAFPVRRRPSGYSGRGVRAVGGGYYNTKVLNDLQVGDEQGEDCKCATRRTYKKYEGMPQPHYTDIAGISIDLDPEARAASATRR